LCGDADEVEQAREGGVNLQTTDYRRRLLNFGLGRTLSKNFGLVAARNQAFIGRIDDGEDLINRSALTRI